MFTGKFSHQATEANPQWEARKALEAAGVRIIDLTQSNPTTAGLDYPSGIPSLFDSQAWMRYRPAPQGLPEAREAIAGYYRSRGRPCEADDLILTASTSEAYSFLFKLLCDPGDEILIPSPTYPLFDALADLEHTKLVRYPMGDFDFLRGTISTRCKALILVNPNNPTGYMADASEIDAYLKVAEEYDLALIVDEVFCEYVLGPKPFLAVNSRRDSTLRNMPPDLLSAEPLVFTLNGFSKMLGLPQLKLGWIHIAGNPRDKAAAKEHLEWIADAFLSVNAPVQTASQALLGFAPLIQDVITKRLRANLATAETMLDAAAAAHRSGTNRANVGDAAANRSDAARITLARPDAGWYAVLRIDSAADDETFALNLLKRTGVHVHPGHLFGFEEGCHLVLSLLGPDAEFKAGLAGILAFAASEIPNPSVPFSGRADHA